MGRQTPWRSPWAWLTAAQGLFALEMMSDLRYRAHRLVDAVRESHDWYATRLSLQLTLLLVLLLLLSAAAAWSVGDCNGATRPRPWLQPAAD